MTNLEKQELRQLCREGKGFSEIRKHVICSDATIRRYMKVFSPAITDNQKMMESFAIQQLTGYEHARHGFDVTSLIDSMGLTKQEWHRIKGSCSFLSTVTKLDIEQYFAESE